MIQQFTFWEVVIDWSVAAINNTGINVFWQEKTSNRYIAFLCFASREYKVSDNSYKPEIINTVFYDIKDYRNFAITSSAMLIDNTRISKKVYGWSEGDNLITYVYSIDDETQVEYITMPKTMFTSLKNIFCAHMALFT